MFGTQKPPGAYVVGADPLSDIAILQVNAEENVGPA